MVLSRLFCTSILYQGNMFCCDHWHIPRIFQVGNSDSRICPLRCCHTMPCKLIPIYQFGACFRRCIVNKFNTLPLEALSSVTPSSRHSCRWGWLPSYFWKGSNYFPPCQRVLSLMFEAHMQGHMQCGSARSVQHCQAKCSLCICSCFRPVRERTIESSMQFFHSSYTSRELEKHERLWRTCTRLAEHAF